MTWIYCAWPGHLKRHRAEWKWLQQDLEWILLTTTVHEHVVTSADAIQEWMPVIWSRITNQRTAPTMVDQGVINNAGQSSSVANKSNHESRNLLSLQGEALRPKGISP